MHAFTPLVVPAEATPDDEPATHPQARQAPIATPPQDTDAWDEEDVAKGWRDRLKAWRAFLLLVLIPTLMVAAFEYLIAADQYESEAHFMVRSAQPTSGTPGSLSQMLGIGGSSGAATETHSVSDYLTSHDAVAAIGRSIDLSALFRRSEADPFTRLRFANATPEKLLDYYRDKVRVAFDSESGITRLTVHAFRPADARTLAELLLRLGEARVNGFNQRAMDDALRVSRQQLREAEAGVVDTQAKMTGLRQSNRNIDPDRTSAAQISMASDLEGRLAVSRAELASMAGVISPSSPQYIALARQVAAMSAQVGSAQARLAGPKGAMANTLGAFESLKLRQEFAAKRYDAAATALEMARKQALGQQLFVVRVVEPNMPVKALYPKRLKTVATVFFGLLLAYAIGWLLLAGVREHAA